MFEIKCRVITNNMSVLCDTTSKRRKRILGHLWISWIACANSVQSAANALLLFESYWATSWCYAFFSRRMQSHLFGSSDRNSKFASAGRTVYKNEYYRIHNIRIVANKRFRVVTMGFFFL